MIVFSFWPDVIMIKEIGDPLAVARHLQLDRKELHARVIMAQGRQNTNYAINLYACHPFFIQGYATMTNGENTGLCPDPNFLESRGFPGYIGYNSDSEVFTHILHYTTDPAGARDRGLQAHHHPAAGRGYRAHPNAGLSAPAQADLPAARSSTARTASSAACRTAACSWSRTARSCGPGWWAANPACSPFHRRSAAWTPLFRCGTKAGIFSPCTWTQRWSARTARRFAYAARKTH